MKKEEVQSRMMREEEEERVRGTKNRKRERDVQNTIMEGVQKNR